MTFKTQADIYKALLAGKTIRGKQYLHKLDEDGNAINKNLDDENPSWELGQWEFNTPSNWEIYESPKWYDNLGEGVLCWVWDSDDNKIPQVIVAYDKDNAVKFETQDAWYKNAEPVKSLSELEKYIWKDANE